MNEIVKNNSNDNVMNNIREQVNAQIASLTTKIPVYQELSDEQKKIVDQYISTIDLSNPKTIDVFGKNETEKIYSELNTLIGTLKTHDISIDGMFTELMMSLDGYNEEEEKGFFQLMRKSPITALKSLKNRPKRLIEKERYRRAKVLTNIDIIQEKLENIRNELVTNAGKLDIVAENSAEQYVNSQYQIIALQEIARRLQEQKESDTQLAERTFFEIDQNIQIAGLEKKINRKIENCRGVSVNAATKAIMSRLLAQHNEELASDYDQDLSSLLPELKGIVVTAEANDSLIEAVDAHNQFVGRMNEMLRKESERSKEAIQRVQEISSGSAIDVETAKTLTNNVLEVVSSLKATQDAGRPTNEAFAEILDDFRVKLGKELDNVNTNPILTPNHNISVDKDTEKGIEEK